MHSTKFVSGALSRQGLRDKIEELWEDEWKDTGETEDERNRDVRDAIVEPLQARVRRNHFPMWTEEDLEAVSAKIVAQVEKATGGTLRT